MAISARVTAIAFSIIVLEANANADTGKPASWAETTAAAQQLLSISRKNLSPTIMRAQQGLWCSNRTNPPHP